MARRLGPLVLCLAVLAAAPARAQVLDPSFGSGGKTFLDVTTFGTSGQTIAVQDDGKVLVAGFAYTQSGPADAAVFVARLLPNGTPDTGFGTNGVTIANVTPGSDDIGNSVAIGPGGVIYVGGYTDPAGSDGGDFLLLRFTSAGQLDPAFSGDGIATLNAGGNLDVGRGVAVQPSDGLPVLAGPGGPGNDFAVARFTAQGVPDVSFDGDGLAFVSLTNGFDTATSVLIEPDGSIVVGGQAFDQNIQPKFWIVRLTGAGQPDPNFGNAGKATIAGSGNQSAFGIARDSGGNLLEVGEQLTATQSSFTRYFDVARFTSGGQPDTTFGGGAGFVTPQFTGPAGVRTASGRAVIPTATGILVGGPAFGDGTGDDFTLATLTPAGALDPNRPVKLFDIAGANDSLNAMALQAAGIVMGGTCDRTDLGRPDACAARVVDQAPCTENVATQPTQLQLSAIDPKGTEPPQTGDVSLVNQGTCDVVVSSVRIDPVPGANTEGFSILEDLCTNVTLHAGGSCRVRVKFDPTGHELVREDKLTFGLVFAPNDVPSSVAADLMGSLIPRGSLTATTLDLGAFNARTNTLTLRVSGPGTLDLGGTTLSPRLLVIAKARRAIKPVHRTIKAAGTVKVKLKPVGAARRTLKRKHRLRVRLKATFRPTTGKAVTKSKTVTLKRR